MALGRKPTIFVSSTCYDLKQIRTDLKLFLEKELGYEVLLSEYDSFPLDPNMDAIGNCLRAVDERADIFVLIVGCRYGSVMESGHSVTNMEYLKAKAKGVPIYAFIDKQILSILPLWKDNPTGNFHSTVDTPKLFEFINSFRKGDAIWSFSFESAQDIIGTLRAQFSYLFLDCLGLKHKATKKAFSKRVQELNGLSFQTVLLAPAGWEYKLFGQVLSAGLDGLADYRRDFKYGITLAQLHRFETVDELFDYINLKTDQLVKAISIISTLIYETLPDAFGAPGIAGDADHIIYAANRMLEVYKSVIDWTLDFKAIATADELVGLVDSFSNMCEITLCDIETFSKEFCEMVANVPDHISENSEPIKLKITLTLNPPNTDKFYCEINKLRQLYGLEIEENYC